jgi:hypothetical protein
MFRCQLVHAQLEQSPAFSALSYVWGDPELKKQYPGNGSLLKVSDNLLEVLLQFRADTKEESQLYWIDAVSVDRK